MLKELQVKNFAIVEDGKLNFESGMTAFTGETGAGKSLFLDAITLLLGAKAHADIVKTGAPSAEVEGVFDLSSDPEKIKEAENFGFVIDPEDGNLLFVRREISAGTSLSKNRIWIQGRSATRQQLQALLGDWVEVSGQHEFLRLGKDTYILDIVDQFGGLKSELREYTQNYQQYRELQAEIERVKSSELNRESRLEFLKFQIDEFEKSGIGPESVAEEKDLLSLRARLGSVEKIRSALLMCEHFVDGSENGNEKTSAGSNPGMHLQLQMVLRELRPFEKMGDEIARLVNFTETAEVALKELSREIQLILRSLDVDPEALENAEAKLSSINRLKRKYNTDTEGLCEQFKRFQVELGEIESSENRIEKLNQRLLASLAHLSELAEALLLRRQEAARALSQLWQADVRELGMQKARLSVQVDRDADVLSNAFSVAHSRFSANAGEEMKALAKVASGGELSRIMLALKHIVAGRSEIGVYLFDEVDTGIGGETALSVAARLRKLASDNQVLVVTHLAQIAARAHYQFRIEKNTESGRTRTRIQFLKESERPFELARMLGGTRSKASLELAKELMSQNNTKAKTVKENVAKKTKKQSSKEASL